MNIRSAVVAAAVAVQVAAHGDPACTDVQSAVIMALIAQPIPSTCLKVVKAANVSTTIDLATFIAAYPDNATALLCSSTDCTTFLKTWTSAPACEMTMGGMTADPADMVGNFLSGCPVGSTGAASATSSNFTTSNVTIMPMTTAKPSSASVAAVGAATAAMFAIMQ
ncbi:Aste57867_10679 [Aphanomyces stellatus]|uniref:Aste57867_10679 protein n=1 Tax=Aphanomyces stellatus TaxID=120398 RepID=A0A485KR34_9STRA|nr:hypothetical protein As57867_010639 [Aphanomyces stellatus]VFT87551.1 Aste57867_10679 [Aphanomyces stellatus]